MGDGGGGVCLIMGVLGLRWYLGHMARKYLIEQSVLEFMYGYIWECCQLSEQQRALGGWGSYLDIPT